MRSIDYEVVDKCLDWLRKNYTVYLITVLKTWGSAPRPNGSLLAIREDGQMMGSVSGGCLEAYLFNEFIFRKDVCFPCVESFDNSIQSLSLPCDSTIQLLLEKLNVADSLLRVHEQLSKNESIARSVNLNTGEIWFSPYTKDQAVQQDVNVVTRNFSPQDSLLLIGAVDLSRYISEIGVMLGYQIHVCDPRQEHRDAWCMSTVDVLSCMPDDAVKELVKNSTWSVLALSHDPKLDDMALMEALKSPAKYVGALGSEANNRKRRQRLEQLGLHKQEIARLHGPIGFGIGSRTPAEIAVAIFAELIAQKNGIEKSKLI